MSNLKKLSLRKVKVKLLATLLILTLTFANFALLGSYMGKSIATEINLANQDNKTNVENVSFDVYLDETDSNVKEAVSNIDAEDMKLYVSLKVQGGGYINNAIIEFLDTNFNIKNKPEVRKVKLGSLQTEKGISFGLPIVAKKDESYNLSLLDMQNKIRLTGEYVDSDGRVTNIDSTKVVKITWSANELTNEDITLNQQLITNKTYNIDGASKRIVQILVEAKLNDNKAPIKTNTIEIKNPQISAKPEKVVVSAYSTKATNGKTSIEFPSEESSSWEYRPEEEKTYIQLSNNANENDIVAWAKNAEDRIVITYIYDGNTEVSPFISNVKSTLNVYGRTQEALQAENTLTLEEVADIGEMVKLENNIKNDIYKGKMYIAEDTNYQTTFNLYVPYSEQVNNITVKDLGDQLAEGISTYYKETKISKAEAIKLLGEEGTITIYNAEDKTTPIKEIVLSEQTEEDYYTISYEENISKIEIQMSKAKTEGTLEVVNTKAIKVENKEAVAELVELTSNVELTVTDLNNAELIKTNNESKANLLEPKTTVNLSVDKTSISALTEDTMRITAEFVAKDETNKLFTNPVLNIKLPAEIKEVVIENITPVVGNDKLSIKSYDVKPDADGNKVIVIELQGEQTEYSQNVASIVLDAKLKTDSFTANKNVELRATIINGAETIEKANKMQIVSKDGLVTKSTVKVGETVIEKVNQNVVNVEAEQNEIIEINAVMLNNYDYKLANNNIVGSIPENGEMKSQVTTNAKNAVVYYSEEAKPQINSESWKTDVENLSNVKSFKIELPDLEKAEQVAVNYKYTAGENTANNNNSTLTLNGTVNEVEKENKLTYITNNAEAQNPIAGETQNDKVNIVLEPKTTTKTIHQEQIITYNIKVTNISTESLNNVTLEYTAPEQATLTELTEAQGAGLIYKDSEEKTKSWEIGTIEPGQTINEEITIRINSEIQDETTNIKNIVTLKSQNPEVTANLTTETGPIKKGDLIVRLGRRDNMIIDVCEKSKIEYIVLVTNNTQNVMNNVSIKALVPNNTSWVDDSELNTDWEYNEKENVANYNIESIGAGETAEKHFVVQVDKLSNSISSTNIDNTAIVEYNNEEYETNVYTSKLKKATWKIEMTSEHAEELNVGDDVKYIIKVTNTGKMASFVTIEDELPEEIQVRKVTDYIEEDNKNVDETTISKLDVVKGPVPIGKTLTIEIEGIATDIEDNLATKQITNIAKVNLGDGDYLESNAIINTIINDNEPTVDPEEPTEPTDPTDPDDPDNPEIPGDDDDPNKDETNSISGLAWLDTNKNGVRDENEQVLQAIDVILLDKEGKQVAETKTSLTGTYKFTNVEKGDYTVVFIYDTTKYAVTKYQVQNATDQTNSDVISKEMQINNETVTVAVTDTIKIQDEDVVNIDIGLIENAKFDLKLNKYISKVILTNSAGTSTYEYENTNLAKVEISAKRIEGTVLLVEFDLEVINEGDVNAYVGDIIDYLPEGLVFTSETNKDWYMDGNKVLHNQTLSEQVLKPGESKTVTLVLTKTLKSNSTGTIENIGEIGESSNLQGIVESDSIAGNKQAGEDDLSSASLIVSIATGSPMMYIGIVIGSMLVLGLGIYIINKKVLKVRI